MFGMKPDKHGNWSRTQAIILIGIGATIGIPFVAIAWLIMMALIPL